MGNSSSHRPTPPPAQLAPPRTPSRPLKNKKRSIVDHPQLVAAPPPPPSLPIPIPSHPGQQPTERPDPPANDSFATDAVPVFFSNTTRHESTHRVLPYNSTRSFGAVRRGGVQGGGWTDQPPPPPAPFVEEVVRSTIPLRINQPWPDPDLQPSPPPPPAEHDHTLAGLVPTHIVWRDGGTEVLLAGTLHDLEWRARQRLRFDPTTGTHQITRYLPPGTYRLKFIVDGQWRCADHMPTATDDDTGNLVNYVDVEVPSPVGPASGPGAEERQIIDARVMKANRRRTYPVKRTHNGRSPTTTRYHPPLLPPSESSFWGDLEAHTEHQIAGWERGRDGVLEKWTNVVPEPLIAAARQEEAYIAAVQAQRETRRGGAGTRRSSLPALGMGVPNIPHAPRLPRHLDKVILNTKSSPSSSSGSSSSGRGSRSGKHKSKSRLGMTTLLAPTPETPATPSAAVAAETTSLDVGLDPAHWAQADDTSVLPVPSHVVLHHLGTSAIKNGVLAVGDTTRYNKKYITTIYYKPT
ncbi:5'-AMP-activated protein kinase beta subunit, interation domain-containing protein [Gautieria morchelliformis]|nr:5'-AMP-activated protein kinase beta subunit, interation domain-containing protein [Gautieria morchelliformis]